MSWVIFCYLKKRLHRTCLYVLCCVLKPTHPNFNDLTDNENIGDTLLPRGGGDKNGWFSTHNNNKHNDYFMPPARAIDFKQLLQGGKALIAGIL